ncbi:MAG: RluA family pseudouridine synthase [Candidatus Omnitrophica bacterium]|nr:RluA family pseudouridine synthase [Candidatus Omnitrophota bacterium]
MIQEEEFKEYKFYVDSESAGRLDKYLAKTFFNDISRTQIQNLIKQGSILLNEKSTKPHAVLKINDQILVKLKKSSKSALEPQNIPLDIVFEDEAIVIINKPAGMIVHPTGKQRQSTLVNALLFHTRVLSSRAGIEKPGIVHRLDKDTSGLIVIAKTDYAHNRLAKQFKERSVYKEYIAFVRGVVSQEEGFIEAPISRSHTDRKKMCISFSTDKQALTKYKVIERLNNITMLMVFPKTGRTHQIRVHLAYIGHPILGDLRYGGSSLMKRQALHAKTIGFKHPLSEKYVEFTSKLPPDMECFLKTLKSNLKN